MILFMLRPCRFERRYLVFVPLGEDLDQLQNLLCFVGKIVVEDLFGDEVGDLRRHRRNHRHRRARCLRTEQLSVRCQIVEHAPRIRAAVHGERGLHGACFFDCRPSMDSGYGVEEFVGLADDLSVPR
jgi:hypothetical protein